MDLGPCEPYARPEDAAFSAGRLWRCPACLLVMRDPVPSDEELLAIYRAADPAAMGYRFEDNAGWCRARSVLISALSPGEGAKILDVGCHSGAFLAALPSAWKRYGIEAEGRPAAQARSQHGIEIIGERIEGIGPEWLGTFDALTLFDVLEHLPDPRQALLKAAELVKPGGLLLFSTGDFDAWTWRVLGRGHWYLQTPQHLTVLSRAYVTRLVVERGWKLHLLEGIPHRHARAVERLYEVARVMHWAARDRRGGWRWLRHALQALPGLSALRHATSVPWAMTLTDHLVAVVRT